MSKIVLVSGEAELPAAVLMRLKSVHETSLSELTAGLAEQRPFVIVELFANDHVEVAAALLDTVDLFEVEGSELEIHELAETATMGDQLDDDTRIDVETLRNLLDVADGYR